MEYGVIYIKVCPVKGSQAEWIKYCHIFSSTPPSFQQNVKEIANDINTKYSDSIVIPMDVTVHPGCTTTKESVEEVANDMYNQFCELADRQGISNSIRCVYSIGEIKDVNVDSTHHIMPVGSKYDDVMIRVGHFLDESDEPGIYKI
jgi:hypothetical protein